MNKEELIERANLFVKDTLSDEPTGHDWWHIKRVVGLSEQIASKEGGDLFKIKLIALLHDIADYKLYEDEKEGVVKLKNFLNSLLPDQPLREAILKDINAISYKGANVAIDELSKEGQIVQDADRLDAIGAIGIARAFAYGGNKNRSMHNPEEKPKQHQSFDEYKKSKGSTINHFYEKLLLLKDRMNTETAKSIATKRHVFMENYLEQFYKEWGV